MHFAYLKEDSYFKKFTFLCYLPTLTQQKTVNSLTILLKKTVELYKVV